MTSFDGEDVANALRRVVACPSPHRHRDSMRAYGLDSDAIAVLIENARRMVRMIEDSDMDENWDGTLAIVATVSMMVGVDMERDRQRKA
jgi:hypothetical protein